MSDLRSIPDRLLRRRNNPGGDRKRQRELLAWLDRHGLSPSLLDLERERERRTNGTAWRLLPPAEQLALTEKAAAEVRATLGGSHG
jgi:hypothetical protein